MSNIIHAEHRFNKSNVDNIEDTVDFLLWQYDRGFLGMTYDMAVECRLLESTEFDKPFPDVEALERAYQETIIRDINSPENRR